MKGRLAHNIATSSLGLNSFVLYEFLRFKGAPLPNSNCIVQLINISSIKKSAEILHGDDKTENRDFEQIPFPGPIDQVQK